MIAIPDKPNFSFCCLNPMYMRISVLPIFTLIAKMYSKRVHSCISTFRIIAGYAHELFGHDGCGDACSNDVLQECHARVWRGVRQTQQRR